MPLLNKRVGVQIKTLYLDCRMGASGAKIMGALVDLLDNPDKFIYEFNRIGIEGVSCHRTLEAKKGITGSQLEFSRIAATNDDPYADEIDDNEPKEKETLKRVRRNLVLVKELIMRLAISQNAKNTAIEIYTKIAKEAAYVYNKDMEYMTLYRTGSRDVIAAVVGVSMLIDQLAPEEIIVSPIAVGAGYTRTTRGRVPIPSTELQRILGNLLYMNGDVESEICSLDGAAILSVLASRSGSMPEMADAKCGAGFGMREYKDAVNCIRAYIGESVAISADFLAMLSADVYNTSDAEILIVKKELADMGCADVCTSIITDIEGNFGYNLKCVVSDSRANAVATEILQKTNAQKVYKQNCSVYEK